MIIERLDLMAFGRFTDVSLDLSASPRRFHLIYGPNESGKSTSLRAITSLFFGVPHLTSDSYVHPNDRLRVGGKLVADDGTVLECVRKKGRKGTLRSNDDSIIDESVMQQMLGGIDETTFLNRFGISHDELLAGGSQILRGEGELGEILFAAGAGVNELRGVYDRLEKATGELFKVRGKATINQSIRELDDQRKRLREAQFPPLEFTALKERLEQKRQDVQLANKELRESHTRLSRLNASLEALPLVPKLKQVQAELSAVVDTPILAPGFSEQRRDAENDLRVEQVRVTQLQNQIERLTDQLEQLTDDQSVRDQEDGIESLYRQIESRENAKRERERLQRQTTTLDREIDVALRGLSAVTSSDENDPINLALQPDDEVPAESIVRVDSQELSARLQLTDVVRGRIDRLIKQHAVLVQQCEDAAEQVDKKVQELQELSQQIEQDDAAINPDGLCKLLEEVESPTTIAGTLRTQQQLCRKLDKKCRDLHQRLGIQGNFCDTVDFKAPPEDERTALTVVVQSASQRLGDATTLQSELAQETTQIQAELVAAEQSDSLPTQEQLVDARQQRDHLLDRLSAAKLSSDSSAESIGKLRSLVRESDRIVDVIHRHHEQIHRRSLAQARLLALTEREKVASEEIITLQARLSSVNHQWTDLWTDRGIQSITIEAVDRWLVDCDVFHETISQRNDEMERLDEIESTIQRSAARIRHALERTSNASLVGTDGVATEESLPLFADDERPESLGMDDFIALHDEAVDLRSHLQQLHSVFVQQTRVRDELTRELPDAKRLQARRIKAMESWQQEWKEVTDPISAGSSLDPNDASPLIRQIDSLIEQLRQRDEMQERMGLIQEEDGTFIAAVNRLSHHLESADDLSENLSITRASERTQRLYQRLQQERSHREGRIRVRRDLDTAQQEFITANDKHARSSASLDQLCSEVGCKNASELPEIERRAVVRDQSKQTANDLEARISILAGQQTIDQFIDSLDGRVVDEIESEIAEVKQLIAERETSLAETQKQVGAFQHEFDQIDGGDHASELCQNMQILAGRIGRDAEEWARLKVAQIVLHQAIEHYRAENQGPVLAHAQSFFRTLTCNEYDQLKVDFDAKGTPTLVGARGDADVPAKMMSTGTADALYLSLRLASLKHQLSHSVAIPLVIDDCLIQLDDERSAAALTVFSELSTTTQVILFTHHQHLIDLAARTLQPGDFHVHQL